MSCEFLFGEVVLAHDIGLHLVDVAELPLARGVVHQADDSNPVFRSEFRKLFCQRFRADFGAQVQKVADLEHALGPQGEHFG